MDTETPVQATDQQEVKPEAQAAQGETEQFDQERAMATIHKLRETEKEFKRQKAELETLKAEKEKRELAELSETERAKKQAEEAQAENARLKADILRRDVIAETGLPAIFADRLKGNTKDEMLADAQELVKTLPTLKSPPRLPATNPANAQTTETDAQKRARLFGTGVNIFDAEVIKERGGGVVWNNK